MLTHLLGGRVTVRAPGEQQERTLADKQQEVSIMTAQQAIGTQHSWDRRRIRTRKWAEARTTAKMPPQCQGHH